MRNNFLIDETIIPTKKYFTIYDYLTISQCVNPVSAMPLALSHPTKSLKTKTTNEEPRAPQAGHGCCPCPKQAELTILFLSTLRAVCGLGSQRSP